jgi:hypothetical protein
LIPLEPVVLPVAIGVFRGKRIRRVQAVMAEELEGIDLDCRRLGEGRFATDEEVEAVFAKYLRR